MSHPLIKKPARSNGLASRLLLAIPCLLPLLLQRAARAEEFALQSPGGQFEVALWVGEEGRPLYRVRRGGGEVIVPSGLGLVLEGGVDWTRGFDAWEVVQQSEQDSNWSPVW